MWMQALCNLKLNRRNGYVIRSGAIPSKPDRITKRAREVDQIIWRRVGQAIGAD